jgi:hypothetical protein
VPFNFRSTLELLNSLRQLEIATRPVSGVGVLCLMHAAGQPPDRTGSSLDKSRLRSLLKAHAEMAERTVVRPLVACNSGSVIGSASDFSRYEAQQRAVRELYERDAIVNSWAAKQTLGQISPPEEMRSILEPHGVDAEFFRLPSISGVAILCMVTDLATTNAFHGSAQVSDASLASMKTALFHALYEALMIFFVTRLFPSGMTGDGVVPALKVREFDWLRGYVARDSDAPHQASSVQIDIKEVRYGIYVTCIAKSCELSGLMSNDCVRLSRAAVERLYPGAEIDVNGPIPILCQKSLQVD